jgi:hypothetical protein
MNGSHNEGRTPASGLTLGRILLWSGLAVLAAAVTMVAWFKYEPRVWLPRARKESVARLAAATNEESARAAVNSLGTFLSFTNGAWVAIRNRDTHAGRVQSHALARTSDGRWLESERHFCGIIGSLERKIDEWRKADAERQAEWRSTMREIGPARNNNSLPSELDLLPLLEASNLDCAVQALLRLGFRLTLP